MDGRIELGKHGLAQGAQMPDYTSRIDKAYDFQKDQIQKELDTQAKRQEKAEGLLGDLAKAKGYGKASRQLHEDAMGVRKRAAELMNNIKAGDISAMTELQDLVGNWKADAAQAEAVKTAIIKIEDQARKNGAKTTQRTWDNIARAKEGTLEDYYNPEFLNFGAETVPDLDADFKEFRGIMDRHLQSTGTMVLNPKTGQLEKTEHTKTNAQILREVEQAARDKWKVYESQMSLEDIRRNYQISSEQEYVDRALMEAKDLIEYSTQEDPTTAAVRKAVALEEALGKGGKKPKQYDINTFAEEPIRTIEEATDPVDVSSIQSGPFDWYKDYKFQNKGFVDYAVAQPLESKPINLSLDLSGANRVALSDDDAEEFVKKGDPKGRTDQAIYQGMAIGDVDPKTGKRVPKGKGKKMPIVYFGLPGEKKDSPDEVFAKVLDESLFDKLKEADYMNSGFYKTAYDKFVQGTKKKKSLPGM